MNFLPQLVGALVILVIGWVVGRVVGGVVRRVADRSTVDRRVAATPLGGALGGTEQAISRSLGRGGAYFVYALALLAAADALAIELLSEWIATAISYIPAFVAGVLVIIIEFILTDFVADVAAGTDAMDDYTSNSRASCSGGTPPRAAWPSATNAGGVKSRRSHSPVENSSTSRPRRATRSATRNFSVLPRAFQSR